MSEKPFRYLKWGDDVVATIAHDLTLAFTDPAYNTIVKLYSKGASSWTAEQLLSFLSERIMSPSRRDIEKLLFRCGLSSYDVFRIADATHAINPRDELWLAPTPTSNPQDAATDVFETVFLGRTDAQGDSVDTPEGFNVKRYGALDGRYGIVKQRISPLSTDVESEIAVYLLAREMGIPCCPARRFDQDSVFSQFCYDFTSEYLVHFRRLFDGPRGTNEMDNLLSVRPSYANDFYRMLILDFVTRQDDRHLSNMAIKVTAQGEEFYPLYDNGRSLFCEDTEQFATAAASDPATYATTFGYEGTYWDHLQDAAIRGVILTDLARLDIPQGTVLDILDEAGIRGYRREAAAKWVCASLDMIREIS